MPLLTIVTTEPRPAHPTLWLQSLSALVARELGKPEMYVMTALAPQTAMTFGGSSDPCCFATLKSIGTFTPADTRRLSALLCAALAEGLGVARNRVYIEFSNPPGYLWAHDGETFE